MKFNFLKNLSLLKLAGIKNFIVIDVFGSYIKLSYIKRTEPIYRINHETSEKICKVLLTRIITIEKYSDIKAVLEGFIKENEIENVYLIIGINEYKFINTSISNDVEDVDLWFLENSAKFLPEGRTADEFRFSYQLSRKDDNYMYFMVAVARADYLNEILKACLIEGVEILTALPLSLTYQLKQNDENKSGLLLDFSEEKITYTLIHKSGNILNGELFITGNAGNNEDISTQLGDLAQTFMQAFNEQKPVPLEIDICTDSVHFPHAAKIASRVFDANKINTNYQDMDPASLTSITAVNKLVKDTDFLNLLEDQTKEKQRELIEKQLSMRVILAVGFLIIGLLLSSYLLNWFFQIKIEEESETLLNINAGTLQLAKLEKDNNALKANYTLLSKLKGNRKMYSKLLQEISERMDNRTCLTGLKIEEHDLSSINLELSGIAYEQQDVAGLINNLENGSNFKNVRLLYSNTVSTEKIIKKLSSRKSLIQFNISARYNAY